MKITAAVATYNEQSNIGRCISSLLSQRLDSAELEILVIDGMSTDHTVDVVRSFSEFGSRIRLIENSRRLQVFAWNTALEHAAGEYFAMILAHAEYSCTYFASCLEVMHRTGAAAVGGVQRPSGIGMVGRAVAFCMSSPFGVGNARFRYTSVEEESDTVFSVFTRTKTLRDLGGYDERIPFDEDSDLNYRIRSHGGKLVTSPKIRVRYFVRETLKGLWKQMNRYGYWRRVTQIKDRQDVPLRVLVPAILVFGLVFSAMLAATPMRPLAAVVPAVYAAFLAIATIVASLRRVGIAAIAVPVVLVTMHCAYGAGFWTALLKGGFALSRKTTS